MSTTTDVAIIGAGPYGLSLAAHLAANVSVRVFGQPMQFWRTNMPEGMVLKSEGFASNLWHPDGALTLRDFCADRGLPYKDSGLSDPSGYVLRLRRSIPEAFRADAGRTAGSKTRSRPRRLLASSTGWHNGNGEPGRHRDRDRKLPFHAA